MSRGSSQFLPRMLLLIRFPSDSLHEADSIYRLGIARKVQPMDRIKRHYAQFQESVMSTSQLGRSGNAGSSLSSSTNDRHAYERILQESSARARADQQQGRSGLQQRPGDGGRGLQAQARTNNNSSAKPLSIHNTANPNRAKTAIFEEKDDLPSAASVKEPWAEVGTRVSRRQENSIEPDKMSGTKIAVNNGMIKRRGGPGAAGPAVPAFDIFEDDDGEVGDGAGGKKGETDSDALARRESQQKAEELRRDPFKNWDSQALQKVSDKASHPLRHSSSASSQSGRPKERTAIDLRQLYPLVSLDIMSNHDERNGKKSKGALLRSNVTGEKCLEEVWAAQRGGEDMLSDTIDPWAHLDALEGKWLPVLDSTSQSEAVSTKEARRPALGEKKPALGNKPLLGEQEIVLEEKQSVPAAKKPVLGEKKPALGGKKPILGEKKPTQEVKATPQLSQPKPGEITHKAEDEEKSGNFKRPRRDVTVTAMTRAAMAEVDNMFNGGTGEDEDDDESDESDSDNDSDEASERIELAPVVAKPIATTQSSAIPSTPAKKPTQSSGSLVSQGQPNLNKPAVRPAQRVYALDTALEEEEEEDEEEPQDEQGYDEFRHELSRITEVTEVSRWTHFTTPGTVARNARRGSVNSDAQINTPLTSRVQQLRATDDESECDSDTNTASGHVEDPSRWGDQVDLKLPDGLTIARRDGDRTGQLSHEQLGAALVFQDKSAEGIDNAEPDETIPNPCAPDDPRIIGRLLSSLEPALDTFSRYVDLQNESAEGRLAGLKQRADQNKRRSIGSVSIGGARQRDWPLEIMDHKFQVREKLGEGAFGSVYLAEDLDRLAPPTRKRLNDDLDSSMAGELADLSVNSDEDPDEAEQRRLVALKVESPPNKWEFYMLNQLHSRLSPRSTESVILHRKFISYSDTSFLLLDFGDKGTLLGLVNNAHAAGVGAGGLSGASGPNGVEEVLAMFFVIELLRIIEDMHSNQLVHGDLKIDNCLLRIDEPPAGETWSNSYDREGGNGWASKGLTLIDFGRSIDLKLYPAGQTFKANWPVEAKDCREMREGLPWTYETDYHGVAAIAFCLLFGKYMEGTNVPQIKQNMRRYWQAELWLELFNLMLNTQEFTDGAQLPILDDMRQIREKMEAWLSVNCNKSGKVSIEQ